MVPVKVERRTELVGCGLPRRKKKIPSADQMRENLAIVLPQELLEKLWDTIFFLIDHTDRKIEPVSRRVAELEERGRSL